MQNYVAPLLAQPLIHERRGIFWCSRKFAVASGVPIALFTPVSILGNAPPARFSPLLATSVAWICCERAQVVANELPENFPPETKAGPRYSPLSNPSTEAPLSKAQRAHRAVGEVVRRLNYCKPSFSRHRTWVNPSSPLS
jgi:hypothetical protein